MARHLISGDTALKAIKPGDPRKRISDGDGLYLLLFVKGGSHGWRLSYTVHGRRKLLSLGTYPSTGLALARKKAEEARRLVSEGIDPSDARKADKQAQRQALELEALVAAGKPLPGSFEAVARDWFDVRSPEWSLSYSSKLLTRLEKDVFPFIGRRPVGEVTPPELLEVLRKIEARGVIETAHRALESCSQIFRFAIAHGQAQSDPGRDLKGLLRKPMVKHFPAITKPDRLAELLKASHGYRGTPVVRTALLLAPLLLLRPGELRHARWADLRLDQAIWEVPAQQMKRRKEGKINGQPHVVPLATQAVKAFRDLQPLTGHGEFVFMGERHHDRPMSENTVNAALRAMGFDADEVSGHGFRATARTMLAERLGFEDRVIEAQLAHSVADSLGRAYNRTEYLEQRAQMMQAWADYLDTLRR